MKILGVAPAARQWGPPQCHKRKKVIGRIVKRGDPGLHWAQEKDHQLDETIGADKKLTKEPWRWKIRVSETPGKTTVGELSQESHLHSLPAERKVRSARSGHDVPPNAAAMGFQGTNLGKIQGG